MEKQLETALNNVTQACYQFKGTKADHIQLQNDLDLIKAELEKIKEKID